MWGLKLRKDEHIWGLRFAGLKKKYLGSKIDGKLIYLGSEILRGKSHFWGLEFGVSLIL